MTHKKEQNTEEEIGQLGTLESIEENNKDVGEELKFGEQSTADNTKNKELNPNAEEQDTGNTSEEQQTEQDNTGEVEDSETDPKPNDENSEEEEYDKDSVQGGASEPDTMIKQNRIQNRFVSRQYN